MGKTAWTLLFLVPGSVAAAAPAAKSVTFTRDVAPIIYNRCAECHRQGQSAPMSLLTYEQARPWAKSIREKVSTRAMPPWLSGSGSMHFENDRSLSQKEIDTIVAWADAGAPKGDDKALPPLPKFADGWTLGQPDVVLKMGEDVPVPADGVIPYKYFTIPTNFTDASGFKHRRSMPVIPAWCITSSPSSWSLDKPGDSAEAVVVGAGEDSTNFPASRRASNPKYFLPERPSW